MTQVVGPDTLVDGDRLSDATDCQTLFNLGEVRLR